MSFYGVGMDDLWGDFVFGFRGFSGRREKIFKKFRVFDFLKVWSNIELLRKIVVMYGYEIGKSRRVVDGLRVRRISFMERFGYREEIVGNWEGK